MLETAEIIHRLVVLFQRANPPEESQSAHSESESSSTYAPDQSVLRRSTQCRQTKF
jgi:hypothetical protein